MLKNYHTHTFRCKHADGTDEQYVEAAIKAGYKVLGFSDHTPWPTEGHWRMAKEDFAGYCESINNLKEKYKDQIDIKLGLEAEYVPEHMDWLIEMVEKYNVEYLIFGNHFVKFEDRELWYMSLKGKQRAMEWYLESAIKGLETGLYSYFAHPDLFACNAWRWEDYHEEMSRKICKYCKEHDIPLEYNLGGTRGCYMYPREEFWKIAKEYNCKAIIGVDAHEPKHLLDANELELAKKVLSELGIEVVEEIRLDLQEKLRGEIKC